MALLFKEKGLVLLKNGKAREKKSKNGKKLQVSWKLKLLLF